MNEMMPSFLRSWGVRTARRLAVCRHLLSAARRTMHVAVSTWASIKRVLVAGSGPGVRSG